MERHSRYRRWCFLLPWNSTTVGKGRFVSKSSSLAAATRGPPCHCRSPRYHRGGQSVREGQDLPPWDFLPSPGGLCAADGLRSALLHCSRFGNFHSPCRVLCTFRSPYLCNIGRRADGGALSEIPQRLRLQVQAALHRRRQQITRSTPSKHTTVRAIASPGGSHPPLGSKEPFHALAPPLFPRKEKRASSGVLVTRASKPCIVSAWKTSTKTEASTHPVHLSVSQGQPLPWNRDKQGRSTFRFSRFSRRY